MLFHVFMIFSKENLYNYHEAYIKLMMIFVSNFRGIDINGKNNSNILV